MMVDSRALPQFPMRRPCPFALPSEYNEMRAERPVRRARLANGEPVWLVSRYMDVQAILTDPRISSDRERPGFPFFTAESEYLRLVRVFVGMDPPEHGPHRRMFLKEFGARNVAALRPFVQQCVDWRIDRLLAAGPPADLVTALALPVPALAMGRILGVPQSESAHYTELAVRVIAEPGASPFEELGQYLRDLVRRKRVEPGDDLISRVSREYVDRDQLAPRALQLVLMLILLAGYETTANVISLGVLTLLRHPEQLARLRTDPELMPAAIDELLRYLSVAELATVRVATDDIELGGETIRAGEGVIPLAASANRDPAVFHDPEVFDINRDARRHIAFGHGVHACPGASLAKLELDIVFSTILTRLPELRLASELEECVVKYEAVLFGLHRMEVSW